MFAALVPACLASMAAAQEDRAAAWTEDVLHLVGEIERLHPEPFHGVPREEFEAAVDAFVAGLEGRGEEENVVELMRLVALLSRGGREGHALIWSLGFEALPVELYRFEDGWFVVTARAPHEALVGKRVVAIAGVPVEELARRVEPLLSRDNVWNLRAKLPMALCAPAILRGLGVQGATGAVELELEGQGKVALEPVRAPPHEPLPPQVGQGVATRRDEAWWTTVLAEERALYVQYNAVQAADGAGGTLADFAAGLSGAFERGGCERLVLDLRWNGGGDNTTFGPLIAALKDPRLDREGRLFALVGRHTFSAAGNFVTVLERETRAILVGEPTGGAPNQYGDARDVRLPHHPGLLVRIATRYHAFGGAEDRRLSHEPELLVPLLSTDSFGGRDAVLRAALEHGRK